jgi:hypothetical protein
MLNDVPDAVNLKALFPKTAMGASGGATPTPTPPANKPNDKMANAISGNSAGAGRGLRIAIVAVAASFIPLLLSRCQ